ncbi:ubiquitin-conjugating enzyme family protein [Artemisia annua]|uniref:Ubiquitin-conjugating enzyme family protein n=1 Tax=Artemisia annua TaxID=35608 RepID=A0A2U1MGC9_ARTAN|nr:ubiquitin-conjugating enzyme family protein [Artemisia annua]
MRGEVNWFFLMEMIRRHDISNMLQLLVYICGSERNPTLNDQKNSFPYNENIVIKSLRTMLYVINKPPKHFEDLVIGHFSSCVRAIFTVCKSYIEGRFLESKKEKRCSKLFKDDVVLCIKPLVDAFIKIGAKEVEVFLYLREMRFNMPDKPFILRSEVSEVNTVELLCSPPLRARYRREWLILIKAVSNLLD